MILFYYHGIITNDAGLRRRRIRREEQTMERKLETFLAVCRHLNYRRAAGELHLTQPAVTKQIQALEEYYGAPLFHYDGRKLTRTKRGEILETYAISLRYNDEELMRKMKEKPRTLLRVGATKTIGDYVLGPSVARFLTVPDHELSLIVDNTERLLGLLEEGKLDFVFVEGIFDKQRYDSYLLRMEPFTGICAAGHPFAGKNISLEQLFDETLILREQGSGTRDIFERELRQLNYTTNAFSRTIYISSFKLIRDLVSGGAGISFAYQAVSEGDDRLGGFTCPPLTGAHELNVVYLKNTKAGEYARDFMG